MKKRFKLGVIGCDDLALNVIKGVILSDFLSEKKVLAGDVTEERFDEVMDIGVSATTDVATVAENCEFLLFSGTDKNFEIYLKKLNGYKPEKVISLIPNLKKNAVKNAFGVSGVKVARCIANLPCRIGSGMIGIDMSDFNSNIDDTEFISNVFNCLGIVLSVDESKLDAVSGMNNPAYTVLLIDSLIDAGVKQGLTKNEAKIIAVQTVLGAAEMIQRDEQTVPELLRDICNGGSAIEAVKTFEGEGFGKIIETAVTACVKRSKELSDK